MSCNLLNETKTGLLKIVDPLLEIWWITAAQSIIIVFSWGFLGFFGGVVFFFGGGDSIFSLLCYQISATLSQIEYSKMNSSVDQSSDDLKWLFDIQWPKDLCLFKSPYSIHFLFQHESLYECTYANMNSHM